eukprot:TRINITY_DN42241_c0_g1_i1.p1 TRINITY_DN42241_c0_g1~~TRINITY_DN42241_c0_g1_i1.p1  ORF type:complete len:379 (+),score=58.39 TRINITY_DN42241_c0_g1_i1:98-1138(+)
MADDPWTILGISRDVSDVDVRAAFRRQALMTHPDKGGTAEAFRMVVQAFETLGDLGRRAANERTACGHETRASPSCQARRTSSRHVPHTSEAAHGGKSDQRGCSDDAARASKASPPAPKEEEKRGDRARAQFPKRSPRAASAKNSHEGSLPKRSKRQPSTTAATAQSASARLFEDLLHLPPADLTKRLDELTDATLVDIDAFLLGADGGDSNEGDLPHDGGDVCDGNSQEKKVWKRKRKVCDEVVDGGMRRRELARASLKDRWGVRQLPKAVEATTLYQTDDSVCGVVRMSNGSFRQGPPRRSLREAKADATELATLHRERGDAAVCAELERREVAAMTAYFLEFA